MHQCCRCNGSGRCKNCSCVKAGKVCIDCLPSKRQACSNIPTQSRQVPPLNPPSTSLSPPPASGREGLGSPTELASHRDLMTTTASSSNSVAAGPPSFELPANPEFTWQDLDSTTFTRLLDSAYNEAVHWRKNCFKIPLGNTGKLFVKELARLFNAFATSSALESVALKAATVLPLLALQKTHRNSKTKDHIACLERRMRLWDAGDLPELVREARAIQNRLPKLQPQGAEQQLARTFAKLMFQGKTQAALQLLTDKRMGNILHLLDTVGEGDSTPTTVKDILKTKHPPSQGICLESIHLGTPPEVHPVIFDSIDAPLIRSIALNTKGAAGPSWMDAYAWRRLCTSFGTASNALCLSLALTAKCLCSVLVDPSCISPLLACRLIALDKNPGVRPVGIGEIPRRIIAKAALSVTRNDILDAAVLFSSVLVRLLVRKQLFMQYESAFNRKKQKQYYSSMLVIPSTH